MLVLILLFAFQYQGTARIGKLIGPIMRKAIQHRFPEFLPHLLLSLHTGMRMSEQYGLRWNQVDLERRQIHLRKTKNGDPRTIPLNAVALGALQVLKGENPKGAGEGEGNGPGLPFPAQRRLASGIAWLVPDCTRRSEDRRILVALQPPYFCQ